MPLFYNIAGLDASFRLRRPRFAMQGLQALGADKHPLAIYARVLQIRVLAGPVNGVIVAAEQFSFTAHSRTLMTD